MRRVSVVRGMCLALVSASAWAVSPQLSSIYPPGAQRGIESEVTFQGGNLQDAVDLLFHDEGIEFLEFVSKESGAARAKIRIAPDARLGTHALRVRTATGISNLRLFSVGNLAEVMEVEPNNNNEEAQKIALGSTVNGRVDSEDVDYYSVHLEKGANLAVETEAIRLGAVLFDIKLRLFGPGGHELVAEDDTALLRQDAGFVITAHETGVYRVVVSEASYGGSSAYHYRLHIGQFPRPFAVTPMGAKAETETTVTWLGDPSVSTQTISLAGVAPGTSRATPRNESGFAPTDVPFRVSPFDGILETEPNNSREQASMGAVPGAFDGVIQEAEDTDWFAFEGKNGQQYDFRLWGRELGSPIDSVMSLVAPSGKQLATDDDARGMDSYFRVTLPEDGVYGIWVADHLRRGGATFTYRVEVTPITRQLRFRIDENEPIALAVPKNNRTFALFTASRTGFDGDLAVRFDGLPAGVTAEHAPLVKGQTKLPVIFNAAADAAPSGALVDLAATFEDVEGRLKQSVTLVEGNNRIVFFDRKIDRLAMAITEPSPFSILIKETNVPVVQGSNKRLRIVATRAEGFTDAIQLRVPYLPGGYGAGTATIAGDRTEVDLLLEAKINAAVGPLPIVVLGDSAGYRVCTPFTPIEVSERWVAFTVPPVDIEQGQETEVTIALTHTRPYEGTFTANMVRLPKGVTSEPREFNHETAELRFPLRVAADSPPGKHNAMAITCTLESAGEPIAHYSGGAQLQIFKPLPAELKQAPPPPKPAEEKKEEAPKRRTRFPVTSS